MGQRGQPRRLVVGNWKMELLTLEAVELAKALVVGRRPAAVETVVCPSFPALPAVAKVLERSSIALGAQDLFWAESGAYTGEVSARDLRSLACRYVIVGHSERRRELGETDAMVNRKVLAALGLGLSPIVCVGESREERQANRQHHVVERQLQVALSNVPPPRHGTELVVAYEPIWAIGTDHPAEPADAHDMAAAIRQALTDVFGERVVNTTTRVLYGGSVRPDNVSTFVNGEHLQGVLVGGASINAITFSALIKRLS